MKRRFFALFAILSLALCPAMCEGGIADAGQMTEVIDVTVPDREPVGPEALNEGVYAVSVDASSSMFKILSCELTVSSDSLSARLVMKSDAYSHLYPGSAEEAARMGTAAAIPLEGSKVSEFSFTVPIPSLDSPFVCAAYSARKQLWYPRTLWFRSDSLPPAAWREAPGVRASDLGLADGVYLCDVALEGKGRTCVNSPARVSVLGGRVTAQIVFSTEKIDYAILGNHRYEPFDTMGGAAFELPIERFDRPIPLIVDSTAITPSVEIPYSIAFDSASLRPAQ